MCVVVVYMGVVLVTTIVVVDTTGVVLSQVWGLLQYYCLGDCYCGCGDC